jgi:hypothetical protein
MASHRISVRRVLELDVPFTWQEAVAVVHEVAILGVINATRNGVPSRIDADTCILTRRGDVELPQTTDVERPDAELQLLRELLTGRETPPELEALVYGAPSKHLTDDLAMFSRPNRRGEIANLAMRALQAEEEMSRLGTTPPAMVDGVRPPEPALADAESSAPAAADPAVALSPPDSIDDELAKLRDQVTARPAPPPPPPPPPVPPLQPSKSRTQIVQAAAAVALTVALGAAWWSWSVSPPTAPDAAPATLPPALVALELDPGWDAVGHRAADIELGSNPETTRAPRLPEMPPRVAGASGIAAPAGESDGLGGSIAPGASSDAATPVASDPGDAAIDALFSDTSVYSGGNAAVVPPLMLFPRMPRSAFPAPWEAITRPYFEVLIDQQGAVEAVRMRGRDQHERSYYQARMMLSAAKAWQFKPAQLEGRPVRYVMRVVPEQ